MGRVRLRTLDRVAARDQRSLEFVLHWRLAMHKPDRPKVWRLFFHSRKPCDHFGAIGMCAVAINHFDMRMQWHVFAEYLEYWLPLDHAATQGVFRLKTDHQYRVTRIAGALREMMQNASVFHHSGGGNDDHRSARSGQCFRLLNIPGVVKQLEAKQFLGLLHHFFRAVESLR